MSDSRKSITEGKVSCQLKCFKRCHVPKRLAYVMSSFFAIYYAGKIAKNNQNVGQLFRNRATFEVFQSANYFSFYNGFPGVTFFLGHLMIVKNYLKHDLKCNKNIKSMFKGSVSPR